MTRVFFANYHRLGPGTLVIIEAIMKSSVILLVLLTVRLSALEIEGPNCNGTIHGVVVDGAGQRGPGIKVEAEPLGVDLSYVLPSVRTDGRGEYHFQNLCAGKWTVVAIDEKTAFPGATAHLNAWLYDSPVPTVKLTARRLHAELRVSIPPKPAFMVTHITDRETKQEVLRFTIKIRAPGQHRGPREVSFSCDPMFKDSELPIPPDKDVIVHVGADGFHEWRQSAGHGKALHVRSGTRATFEAELEPLGSRKSRRLRQATFQ